MIKRLKYRKWKKIIEKSGLFDVKYYLFTYSDVRVQDIDPIKHYILHGVKEGRNPNEEFDTIFYLANYPDVRQSNINPLVHYILYGKKENRKTFKEENSSVILHHENSSSQKNELLQKAYELLQKNNGSKEEFDIKYKKPFLNYLESHKEKSIDIPSLFSSELYKELYSDMQSDQINPLIHYLKHGQNEGRVGYLDLSSCTKKGKVDFDVKKETVVFVSHESSATGAPLLGLNIGKYLSNQYNVVHYVMRTSNIHDAFFDDAFLVVERFYEQKPLVVRKLLQKISENYNINCVVCNSVVTYPVLEIARDLKIPTVSLIHEFAEYTKPQNKMLNTIVAADKVILPAKIIQNSIMEQINSISGVKQVPSNIVIRPQGKLSFLPQVYGKADSKEQILKKLNIDNKNEYKIIVASGYAQIRKGLDLFIYTANYVKQYYKGKCKFVWVGDGFNPEKDFSYSLWLNREIKHLGLEEDFVFLEHQKNLDNIFSIADVFCLSSRMDPFPNVVIDALEANLPIACFKDASGSVEFLEENNADCLIAKYLDTHQLGKMIADNLRKVSQKSSVNKSLVKAKLNFDEYSEFIIQMIKEAKQENLENKKIFEVLKKSEYFDNDYVQLFDTKNKSLFYHILIQRKGLNGIQPNPNPNPGFSNLKWTIEHKQKNVVPLYEALEKKIYTTHECKIVPFGRKNSPSIKFAIHLHLYYTDLADEFCSYFKNLPVGYDLYVTIVNENDIDEVHEKFKGCGAANIEVIKVKNIGRDIAPMIFDLKDKIVDKNYEVIGHFHSKKSISTNNDMGNRWRKYLLNNLIGDKRQSCDVLSLFNDKKIGLVFAEDNHYMDIGENKIYLDELCEMMDISKVEETPLFPLGNMYWLRVNAIKQLFLLDKNKIIQQEPLPYDGSFMHAIERVTPNLVVNNNFRCVTVYRRHLKW